MDGQSLFMIFIFSYDHLSSPRWLTWFYNALFKQPLDFFLNECTIIFTVSPWFGCDRWQSAVRLAKGSGGFILRVLKPQTDSGGLEPPYWKTTLSCCDWKSKPSIRSAQSPGRIGSWIPLFFCSWYSRSALQVPITLAEKTVEAIEPAPLEGCTARPGFFNGATVK